MTNNIKKNPIKLEERNDSEEAEIDATLQDEDGTGVKDRGPFERYMSI